jgi:23S rRNA pseudouridine2605 synthase
LSTSPEFNEEQLAAARKPLWQQAGAPMITLEAAREWIERMGLVPFAPGKLAMTAPSVVEATLGEAKEAPSAADAEIARELVGRLASEGAALPLNLLGSPGDAPDFVVSGSAFKYIFTLRGDKSWKQAPSTTGAVKVSPLGLRVYETLVERGALSAAELANELGREVTEGAIVRSLSELWQMLRVLPAYAQGGGATMWELTNKRLTKSIKAGVNAGQPTALSALVSLYLGQVVAATGEEVETFLSPLAARSRVREVLHALTGARELGEVVVAGKTLLHVSGELPEFAAAAGAESDAVAEGEEPAAEGGEAPSRISKFAGAKKKTYAERSPFAKRAVAATTERPRTREGGRVAFKREGAGEFKPKRMFGGDRPTSRAGVERKPFVKRAGADEKPTFTKPWNEEKKTDKKAKPAGAFAKYSKEAAPADRATRRAEKFGEPFEASKQEAVNREERANRQAEPRVEAGAFDRPKRAYTPREGGKPFDGPKRPYTPRGAAGAAGSFDRPKRAYTPRGEAGAAGGFDRPKRAYTPREGRKSFDGPKRPYTPREGAGERKPFGAKPAFGRKPFDGPKRPYTPRGAAGAAGSFDRPKRAYTPREGGKSFDGPKRPYTPRGEAGAAGGFDRPKRAYTPREGGKSFDGPKRPYTPRGEGGAAGSFDRPKRAYTPREGAGERKPFGARPAFGSKPAFGRKPFDGEKKPYRPRTADGEGRPQRKTFSDRPKFGGKPGGNFRAKPSGSAAGKPKYGAGKLFDKKGPLPADGEGGLSPKGSKRRQKREQE